MKRKSSIQFLALVAIIIFLSTFDSFGQEQMGPITYRIVELGKIPHLGVYRFTEGLEYHDGYLYEGTGKTLGTVLKKIDPASGEILMQRKTSTLFNLFFGEGITILDNKIIQLSWHNGKAFVYHLDTFNKVKVRHSGELFWHHKTFPYHTPGWGLTKNEDSFIMSDGSSNIYFRDFQDFSLQRALKVTLAGKEVTGMNELEYANGIIYANIFPLDYILMIDAVTGQVVGNIPGKGLLCAEMPQKDNVLNGIAYDPAEDVFYLTGKNCPWIYKVRFEVLEN
jgi:glutaminyl-peptide cyclotransferase